ncbi:unnamed protein product, partial [marine sediment metagenome]
MRSNLGLTPREIEVLDLVKLGNNAREVASKLGVSTQTVKNHLHIAFIRLQATNRTDAVVKALKAGYIK